jgi:hypothetical protein
VSDLPVAAVQTMIATHKAAGSARVRTQRRDGASLPRPASLPLPTYAATPPCTERTLNIRHAAASKAVRMVCAMAADPDPVVVAAVGRHEPVATYAPAPSTPALSATIHSAVAPSDCPTLENPMRLTLNRVAGPTSRMESRLVSLAGGRPAGEGRGGMYTSAWTGERSRPYTARCAQRTRRAGGCAPLLSQLPRGCRPRPAPARPSRSA